MSITKLQDKPIIIGSPIEIEFAVNEIRKQLATIPWVSHPYFIAQRFYYLEKNGNRTFYYPETYAPTNKGVYGYHRLTPDSDYPGMFFFLVGDGTNDFEANQENFITYPVSIIFSTNLKLINEPRLEQGLFTQDLLRDVRYKLTNTMINHDFDYQLLTESRDLRTVYREFTLKDLDTYNRAPLQCFRFDLSVRIQEGCLGLYEWNYQDTYE